VAALAVLALITLDSAYLPWQRTISRAGQVIEVRRRQPQHRRISGHAMPPPPVVDESMAPSSNLEIMRHRLAAGWAEKHRVILIDRPGMAGSTRARLDDSTAAIQGNMIHEALEKLWRRPRNPGGSFLERSARRAPGARLIATRRGLVMLAPVAYPWNRRRRMVTKRSSRHACDSSPLLAYTITLPAWFSS